MGFVQQLLRDRGEPVPPEDTMDVARRIKEQHGYVCQDIVKEYEKYDQDNSNFKLFKGEKSVTKQVI